MNVNNKIGLKLASMVALSTLSLPLVVVAEENGVNASTSVSEVRNGTSTKIKDIKGLKKEEIESLRAKEKIEALRVKAGQKIEDRKEKIEDRINKVASSTAERREKRNDKITERFSEFMAKFSERLDATIDRFNKIVLRIESRIDKLNSMGIDTSESAQLLVEAKAKIEIAKTSISLVDTSNTATSTEALRVMYPDIKIKFEKAKSDLKIAQEALSKVVRSLSNKKIEDGATTTSSIR